jgi:hemerythrin-like domain-containing protein
MTFSRQIPRLLDEEHRNGLDLLSRFEHEFDAGGESRGAAAALVRYLEHEIGRHFGFEEEQLFPLLTQSGDNGIVTLLSDEHEAIREVAEELLPLARAAVTGALPDGQRRPMHRLFAELVERQVSHIQKETMALLPMLDHLLEDEADRELALAYAGG